jgi:A/G-specific adenine glycosylase
LYPWRRPHPDPYHVLVSEVMLQQTQVARIVPAFEAFVRRFPSIRALAAARRRDVLSAWAGLGYNRRAVWLSASARVIVREHLGVVPSAPEDLLKLPGVGPYTAAAVAAIAYGVSVPAVDTNVRRVVARARLGVDGSKGSARALHQAAARWMGGSDPAEWNQAVMDLGREICRPTPRCESCPLARSCAFRLAGGVPAPRRPAKGGPFEGSFRQLRGAVIRVLRERSSASIAQLAGVLAEPDGRVAAAVTALHADGLVEADAAARRGSPVGRVRFPE